MNARIALILVILLAVLGGAALVYQYQERSRRPENVGTLGQTPFRDLKAAEIATIRIAEPKETLTLQRTDTGWVIAERGRFPADVAKVREFVLKVISLKVGQSEPIGDKDRARLNLDQSGTQVEFLGADGKALRKLTVGKKYFKREVDNPEKAAADGRFLAVPEEARLVYIVAEPLAQATTKSAEWIDKASFQVEKVKTLEVRYPDGSGWRIERDGDNADWKLAGLKAGEKLDVSRANAASYSLSLLELADVAPAEVKELAEPTLVKAATLDGLAYDIQVGRLQGDNYPVRFTSSGTVAPNEKDAERIKKLQERRPREEMLSRHTLLIAKSKLEDTLKKRDDLLEKNDARK
ncbi:MAG: DUF4340 domain-containing protein [Betaproteobacteria bacterium]